MTNTHVFTKIKDALENAPRNAYVAEFHLQVLKYAENLNNVSGKEFCESIEIGASFSTEYLKMKKIAERLRKAGLDPNLI